MSPLNVAFGAVAVAAVVLPIARPPAQVGAPDYVATAQALATEGIILAKAPASHDVAAFTVTAPGCTEQGRLVMAGYGSRAEVRAFVSQSQSPQQLFFSGRPAPSFDEAALWKAYIFDQVGSKFGFAEDGAWARRLLAFAPPGGCASPVSLSWDGRDVPRLVHADADRRAEPMPAGH